MKAVSLGRKALAVTALAATAAWAQYPGQVTRNKKDAPELRSIAVLEWTGDAGKPKKSRLVPVAVLDGGELQDGSIYMARPEPMALAGEVEYELQQNGKPVGLFDIKNAGQEQGSWVGYGAWKALPVPKKAPSMTEMAKLDVNDADSDRPVLHRKHHADDPGAKTGGEDSGGQAAPSDPDRPTLHKKTSDSGSDNGGTADSSAPSDQDRPTLHKKTSDNGSDSSTKSSNGGGDTSAADSSTVSDPDRPQLKKSKKKEKEPEDIGHAEALPGVTDPDRPMLKRGKSNADTLNVTPSLMGLPADMQQAVAVSDSRSRPEHPWSFSWANPDDEAKMKAAMEDLAREAMGLNAPPPAPATKRTTAGTTKASAAHRTAKPAAAPPSEPAPLMDEQFRVFELAYGSGATLVLSAHSDAPFAQQKFVTLIAQPDLYGNLRVVMKSVTDGTHLDETPRMRLVDAVDAMADNRGELLFELRGSSQRQFALYRIYRGEAEKLFAGAGGDYGLESRN